MKRNAAVIYYIILKNIFAIQYQNKVKFGKRFAIMMKDNILHSLLYKRILIQLNNKKTKQFD